MSDVIAQLKAVISLDSSQFDRGIRNAGGALSGMDRGMKVAAGGANVLKGALSAVAKATVVLGLVDVGKQAIETAVKFQGYSKSLEATLGSSQRVAKEMRDLKEIAKLPGIGLEESIQSFQRFVAVGAKTDLAKNLISGLGKLNAVSGGSVENFNEAGRQFSQIMSAGKITEENLGVIKERLPAFAKLMKDTFGTSTAEGLKTAGVSVDQFVAKMSDAMRKTKGVTETAQNSFDNLSAASTDALNTIGTMLLPVALDAVNGIGSVLTTLSDGLSAFASSSTGKQLFADLTVGFTSFRDAAVSVGSTVTQALAAVGVSIKSGDILAGIKMFGDGFKAAGATVETFAKSQAFKTFVTGVAQGVQQVVEHLRPVVDWFTTNMPLIQRTVQTVVAFVTQFWAAHGKQIMAVVGPVYGQLKDLIVTAITTIGNVVKLAMQVITGDWRGAGNTIKTIVSGLASFLGRTFSRIGEIVTSFGSLMLSTLGDLAGRVGKAATSIGKAILNGIGGAIRSGANYVVSAVTDLGTQALSAIKKKLGIASPSKEFARVGAFAAQGFAQGLESKMSAAVAMSKKLGTASLNWLQVMLTPKSGGALKQENDEAKRLLDTMKQLVRARLAMKYGENSKPVLRFDFPHASNKDLKGMQSLSSSNTALEASKRQAQTLVDAYKEARKQHLLATATTPEDKISIELFDGKRYDQLTSAANRSAVARIASENKATDATIKNRQAVQDQTKATEDLWTTRLRNWFQSAVDAEKNEAARIQAITDRIAGLNREYKSLIYSGSEWGKFLMERAGTDFELGIDPDDLRRLREEFVTLGNVAQARGLESLRERLRDLKIATGEVKFSTTEARIAWEQFHLSVDKLSPEVGAEVRKLAGEFDRLNAKAKKLEGIRQAGQTIKDVFRGAFETVLTTGKNFFQSLVDGFKQAIIRILAEKAAAAVASGAESLLKNILGLNKKDEEGSGESSNKGIGSAYSAMSRALDDAKRTPTPVIVANATDLGTASASQLAPLISQLTMPRAGGMPGIGMPGMGGGGLAGSIATWGVGQAFGAAAGAATAGLFPLVDGITGGALSGFIGDGLKGIGKIFGFADGGRPPLGRPSIIGERGPELWVPDQPGRIYSNRDSQSILGSGEGTVNFNGTVNFSDAADVKRIQSITRARRQSRLRLA